MPAIEVDGLTISYGPVRAVDHLTFQADAGQVLALLGPNGAGKTSTVEAMVGFRRPAAGSVRVLGLDPAAQHDQLTALVGVMPQEGGVQPGIRPIEALRHGAALHQRPDDPVALLERVGLTHRARATWRHLSGGEQQRLSLALALVGRPRVAFLDEPTAGVDVQGRHLVRGLVRDLAQEGVCVVLTTHDLDEAERVADRVVIIDHGQLITSGTPRELMAAGSSREILFGAPPAIDIASLGKALLAAVEEVSPGEYRVDLEPSPGNIAALTTWLAEHDLPLADLRAGRQRLEDVFVRLTQITGEVPAVRISPETTAARRGGRGRNRPRGAA